MLFAVKNESKYHNSDTVVLSLGGRSTFPTCGKYHFSQEGDVTSKFSGIPKCPNKPAHPFIRDAVPPQSHPTHSQHLMEHERRVSKIQYTLVTAEAGTRKASNTRPPGSCAHGVSECGGT